MDKTEKIFKKFFVFIKFSNYFNFLKACDILKNFYLFEVPYEKNKFYACFFMPVFYN